MIQLIFVRHGSTVGNLEKRYIGRTDEPLCEEGVAQITALKEKNIHADRIFISPMRRTRQTAEILFPNAPYTVKEDFRETDFGIFEGKTANELSDCKAYRKWVDSFCQEAIPDGEAVQSFKKRCCTAFEEAVESIKSGETAVFVVHGGVIMAVMEAFAVPKKDFYDYHVANGKCLMCIYENNIIKRQEP